MTTSENPDSRPEVEIIQPQIPPEHGIPVRIKLPEGRPLVTYTLIGLTVLVFLAQLLTRNLYGVDLPYLFGVKSNDLILRGQYWRLITPLFLHADILHIGFNMYALYILGTELERFYGHGRFLFLYLVSGFGGVVASFWLTQAASLGASTSVFGLLGAYGVLAYKNQRIFGQQSKRILRNVFQIAGINLLLGLMPSIDNWGHLGGLIGGVLLSWFGGPEYEFSGSMYELHLGNKRTLAQFFGAVIGVSALFALLATLK